MSRTVLAQINATSIPQYFGPAKYFNSISSLVDIAVPAITLIAALSCLGLFFYSAFKVLTGSGDPESMASARNTATFAIIGLILIVCAFLIVRIIGYVLDVDVPL